MPLHFVHYLFYRISIFLNSLAVVLNSLPVCAHTLLILFFTDFGIFFLSLQVNSGFFELPFIPFEIEIVRKIFHLVNIHPSFNPPGNGGRFVIGKIVPRLGAKEDEDLLQCIGHITVDRDYSSYLRAIGRMPDISDELVRHFFHGQNIIHKTRIYGAPRHACVLGRGAP